MKILIYIISLNFCLLHITAQFFNNYEHDFDAINSFQKLDSVSSLTFTEDGYLSNGRKTQYNYNNIGRILSEIEMIWDYAYTNKWIFDNKTEYYYNENNNIRIRYLWKENRWNNFQKIECRYNNSGSITDRIISKWNEELNEWTYIQKLKYTFDEIENEIQQNIFVYDKRESEWKNDFKYQKDYDRQGNITKQINYDWNSLLNAWINDNKYEYSYDSLGNRIEFENFDWDNSNDYWRKIDKYDYSYDANNNLNQRIYYIGDEQNNWIFDGKYKIDRTYNINDKENQTISFIWDSLVNDWKKSDSNTYLYNDYGYIEQNIQYNWDTVKNKWVEDAKYEYQFPTINSIENFFLPDEYLLYDEEERLRSIIFSRWNDENKTWITTGKKGLYFSNFNQSNYSNYTNTEFVKIYPNPTSKILFIEFPQNIANTEISIYDINGKIVYENSGTEYINVSGFHKGIYFLQIKYIDKTSVLKKINIE